MASNSLPRTLNINQWFETTSDSHVRHETHMPDHITAEMLKEDFSDKTCPLGHKANLVAPNHNNSNNTNIVLQKLVQPVISRSKGLRALVEADFLENLPSSILAFSRIITAVKYVLLKKSCSIRPLRTVVRYFYHSSSS